jgi:hypothetical protein
MWLRRDLVKLAKVRLAPQRSWVFLTANHCEDLSFYRYVGLVANIPHGTIPSSQLELKETHDMVVSISSISGGRRERSRDSPSLSNQVTGAKDPE